MILNTVGIIVAACAAFPLFIVGTQALIALLLPTARAQDLKSLDPSCSYRILIPAHNEAKIIGRTLARLITQLPDSKAEKNIILVADNCSDKTAEIARAFGVTVVERNNPLERGKGFALDFGLRHISGSQSVPGVVVILDADCETTKQALVGLIATAWDRQLPAQMIYLMRPPVNASIKQKIAGFAWLLKNKIRLLAMNALKLPVILTGTGMAFPWQALAGINLGNGNIVEDMQLGIDCSINGFPPVLCPEAVVYSDFPDQAAAEQTQRTRWEHGHLQTILKQTPRLVKEAWKEKSSGLLALAIDIGVPPLSLLIMVSVLGMGFFFILGALTGNMAALQLMLAGLNYFAIMLIGVWWRFGRDYLTPRELIGIPVYIFQKLTLYKSFITKPQQDWVRTERD